MGRGDFSIQDDIGQMRKCATATLIPGLGSRLTSAFHPAKTLPAMQLPNV
jgi:hypothetical protein